MATAVPFLLVNTRSSSVVDTSTTTSRPQTSGGGKAGKSHKKYLHDKDSQEYKKRRERNNVAVRKSRDKSRTKTQETLDQISDLKVENARLESKIQLLSKELSVLKDLFLSNAEELPDPSTTFGLFNSGASRKLEVAEPVESVAPLGSKLVVANTIEVSVDGEVTQIIDGDGSIRVPPSVAEVINSLASSGHQVVITQSTD